MRYHLYVMSGTDPAVRASEIECPDDAAAIGRAIGLSGVLGLELWRGTTLIIRLNPANTRLTVGPAARMAA